MINFFDWQANSSCNAEFVLDQLSLKNRNANNQKKNLNFVSLLGEKPMSIVKFSQLLMWTEKNNDTNSKSNQTNNESMPKLFREFLRLKKTEIDADSLSKTVFVINDGGNFPTHGSLQARMWMQSRYLHRFVRDRRRLVYFDFIRKQTDPLPTTAQVLLPLDDSSVDNTLPALFVAMHVRRGDALTDHASFRTRWLWWYATVARQIEAASRHIAQPRFVLFSEGNASDFDSLRRKMPTAYVVLGNEQSVFVDIDHMAHAHVLVAHVSSFSRLCAELNPHALLLMSEQPEPERFMSNMIGGGNTLLTIDADRGEFDFDRMRRITPDLIKIQI